MLKHMQVHIKQSSEGKDNEMKPEFKKDLIIAVILGAP